MGRDKAREFIQAKFSVPFINLKAWNYTDWLIFWVLIPLIIVSIYYSPSSIKEQFFILNTSTCQITSIFFHEFTHSSESHLLGNLGFYYVWLGILFAFEKSKKVFHFSAVIFFFSITILGSVATIVFWDVIGKIGTSQGFSGFVAALSAYASISLLRWVFVDIINFFPDWYQMKKIDRIIFFAIIILLAFALLSVITVGLKFGLFISGNGFVSNGIVHLTGYLIGLIVPLFLYRKFVKKELIFDSIVLFSVFLIILQYYLYLQQVVMLVKGTG